MNTLIKTLILVLFFLLSYFSYSQTTVVLGSGSSTSSTTDADKPIYSSSSSSSYTHSKSVHLVPQSNLQAASVPPGSIITHWGYNKSGIGSPGSGIDDIWTLNVYLKNSSATALNSGTDWNNMITGATLVYSNIITNANMPSASGFWQWTLGTTFIYTGNAIECYIEWVPLNGSSRTTAAIDWLYDAVTDDLAMGDNNNSTIPGTHNAYNTASRMYQIQLTYNSPPVCSAIPNAGNTISSDNNVCPADIITLFLDNSFPYSGIVYNWQYSYDASSWYSVFGNDLPTYVANIVNDTYFRCIVTCPSFGSDTSTQVLVISDNQISCYCEISPKVNTYNDGLTYIEFNTIANASTGTPAYSDYTAQSTIVLIGDSYPLTVQANTDGNYTYYQVAWIDWNKNGYFELSEKYPLGSAVNVADGPSSGSPYMITVPANAITGTTIMRVVSSWENGGTYSYWSDPCTYEPSGSNFQGEAEDYSIIVTANSCAGLPSGGIASLSNYSGCLGVPYLLTLSSAGYSLGYSGLTYQWQSSPDGTSSWSDISGANDPATSFYYADDTTYFRLEVTCTNSSSIMYSDTVVYTAYVCDNIKINDGTPHTMTSCAAMFYDDGGAGGDYSDVDDQITICSPSGESLKAEFLGFNTDDNGLFGRDQVRYDILEIHDGNNTSSPQLFEFSGEYTSQNRIPVVISSGGCLTFNFLTTAGTVNTGWEALISCTNENNNVATQFCETAPHICDLNGYVGSTSNFYNIERVSGQITDGGALYPTSYLDNNSFITFTASNDSVVLGITVENCSGGISGFGYHAIQFAVYSGVACSGFNLVSPTEYVVDGLLEGSQTITLTGLTPGTNYYIMTDGYDGSVCDYSITAESGISFATVDVFSGCISSGGDIDVTASGGTNYIWNGPAGFSSGNAVVTLDQVGTYTVTISGGNPLCPANTILNVQISDCTVLPVELLDFKYHCSTSSTFFEWSTASEVNNDYFILEYSEDNITFVEIARVNGHGNTSGFQNYSVEIPGLSGTAAFVRLKQIDYNGLVHICRTLYYDCDNEEINESLVIYPNPFLNDLNITFMNYPSGEVLISLYDRVGRMISNEKIFLNGDTYKHVIRTGYLPQGIYYLQIENAQKITTQKIVH